MKIYNMMSGQNFDGGAFSSAWIMSWIGLLVIVVVIMLGRKWLGEEEMGGYPYNWIGSFTGPIIYFLFISFTGLPKWGLLIGVIGTLVGGFLFGSMSGGGNG